MEPLWDPVIINGHQVRPGQRRDRLMSEHIDRHPQMYYRGYHGDNGLLVPAPAAGVARMRATSASDVRRPTQIVINNEFENHSPQPSPHRHQRHSSHGHDYHYDDFSDDSFDDRAHSPHRHRNHRREHSRRPRSPSRSPGPYYDFEHEKLKEKVERLEREKHQAEEEERLRERYEEERLIEEAKKAKKKKDEEAFRKKVIEEEEIRLLEKKAKEAEENKKAEEKYKERVKKDMEKAGYSDEDIARFLKGKAKDHGHGHGHEISHVMDLTRPTYLKVHRRHLSPKTLEIYELPWGWDEHDANYIIIKRWVPEHEQTLLFEHTKKLREKKMLTDTTVELKKERDKLFLVRQKSPARKRSPSKSWMVTRLTD